MSGNVEWPTCAAPATLGCSSWQMAQVISRFYAESNGFLPGALRPVPLHREFEGTLAVRGLIESLGVPLTEVDLILVNGETKPLTYRPRDTDLVGVFPNFEWLDIQFLVRLRP